MLYVKTVNGLRNHRRRGTRAGDATMEVSPAGRAGAVEEGKEQVGHPSTPLAPSVASSAMYVFLKRTGGTASEPCARARDGASHLRRLWKQAESKSLEPHSAATAPARAANLTSRARMSARVPGQRRRRATTPTTHAASRSAAM